MCVMLHNNLFRSQEWMFVKNIANYYVCAVHIKENRILYLNL